MTEGQTSKVDNFGIVMPKRIPRVVVEEKMYKGMQILEGLSVDAPKDLWKSTCVDAWVAASADESGTDYGLDPAKLFAHYCMHLVSNPYGPFIFYSFACKKLIHDMLLKKSARSLPESITREELRIIEDKLSILAGLLSTKYKEQPAFFAPGSKYKSKDQKVQESIEKCWAHIRMLGKL
jgi:hypothetical protein